MVWLLGEWEANRMSRNLVARGGGSVDEHDVGGEGGSRVDES